MVTGACYGCNVAWFRNQYLCEDCECEWQDEWSATCDDDCPECGSRHMEPFDSIDLTETIEEFNGKFLVYRSPDSAEDSADYELIAECGTREAAEEFLKNDNEESERRDGPIGFAD
jgi:hypothetical protein